MGVWTVTAVVVLYLIRHMRRMIRAVQIDTVPAAWEIYLCTHSVRAIVIEEIGSLSPIRVPIVLAAVIWHPVLFS